MQKQQPSSKPSDVAAAPKRKRAVNRACLLRASLPHGMPLVKNMYYLREYIPEIVRRLEETGPGDIISVLGYNDLCGVGKSSVLAAVLQEEKVQTIFSAMFWINLGAYADDAELFGAMKVLAIDVYYTLRNLAESIGHDSETAHVLNKCGRVLGDLDSLESAESVMREIVSATKKCLVKRGYGPICPLLVLDDLWSQRVLLLLRETGFTILVTPRYENVLTDDQFAGCCYSLDPLPTESCLRMFFSLSPLDRVVFEKLPSSRELVRLCASFVTPLELGVLAGLTHHWNPSALPMKVPDVLRKREKILSSSDRMTWIDKYWTERPAMFSDKLPSHRGLLTSMLLSIETLDELVLKCYLSLVVVPRGVAFEFDFLRSLWDLGSDEVVKAVVDILVQRHLVVCVVESPPLSSKCPIAKQPPSVAMRGSSPVSADGTSLDDSTASKSDASASEEVTPILFSFEESMHNHSKLEGLYQLHSLHSDFLLLCALNFAAVANKSSSSGIAVLMSMFESTLDNIISNWHSNTFSAETRCIVAITQSCDRAARLLASKDLLLSTDPSRLFLLKGFWKRLELLNELNVWEGLKRTHPQHPCILPYMQQRMRTEVELEGISGARPFMTKACMMLELVNSASHYTILEDWYKQMLCSYGSPRLSSEHATALLEQARVMNCLGELLIRRGQPVEALVYHRKSLLIYPQFINEDTDTTESKMNKALAERGMLTAMENVALAITRIPKGDIDFDPQAVTEAADTQRLVVRMKQNMFGSQHVGLGSSITRLAEMLCEEGKYNEAIVEHEKALELFAKRLGINHIIYQSAKGEYGLALLFVACGDETAYTEAVGAIQDAVVWMLQHGVSWEDPRIRRLRQHLPAEIIEYLTESIVGSHYINKKSGMFPMCGLESLMLHDCVPTSKDLSHDIKVAVGHSRGAVASTIGGEIKQGEEKK